MHHSQVTFAEQECFKGPYCPVRNNHRKSLILANNTFVLTQFEFQIVAQQARFPVIAVGFKRSEFSFRKIRNRGVDPNLAMRMRIAGAHERAAIFEDLYVTNPGNFFQLQILFGPHLDDFTNFTGRHERNGQVVPGTKTDHAA